MKKIIFVLLVLAGFMVSCTKNFEDFNTDKKHPSIVPGEFLFSNAQKALGDQVASTNVNLNVFKLWAQYWTETTYTDEANYDLVTRNISDLTFRTLYRDVLMDLKEARLIIEAEQAIGEEAQIRKQNKLHVITIVECYAWEYLVTTFGDIPYSEALNEEITQPKYDDALTIYLDLLTRLEEASSNISVGNGSFGANDLYFQGDDEMWKKFGNSLIVRIATVIADGHDASGSLTGAVERGVFGPGEGAFMYYTAENVANSNPLWQDLVNSGRNDFVPANTIVDIMNTLEDPRRDDYFTYVEGTETYQGGIYGETSPFGQLSHIADAIQDPTFPVTLMDYSEVAFYLAEAAARGWIGDSPEEWYNEAITSSIISWGGTQEEADAYLAKPEVAYETAEGDWREKIGVQEWIAFYTRGLEGWTTWRRLDAPEFNIAPTIQSVDEIPVRFTYPITDQTLNASNYAAASDAIGGDELTTPLFWDIN